MRNFRIGKLGIVILMLVIAFNTSSCSGSSGSVDTESDEDINQESIDKKDSTDEQEDIEEKDIINIESSDNSRVLYDEDRLVKLTLNEDLFNKIGIQKYSEDGDESYWFYNKRSYESVKSTYNNNLHLGMFNIAGFMGSFGLMDFSKFETNRETSDYLSMRYLIGVVERDNVKKAVFYKPPHEGYFDAHNKDEETEFFKYLDEFYKALLSIEGVDGAKFVMYDDIREILFVGNENSSIEYDNVEEANNYSHNSKKNSKKYYLRQDVYLRSSAHMGNNIVRKVYAGDSLIDLEKEKISEVDPDGRERIWIRVKTTDGDVGYVSNRAIDCTDKKPWK